MRSTYLELLDGIEDPMRVVIDFYEDVGLAVHAFEALCDVRVSAISSHYVVASYVQSGLGNREPKAFRFDSCTACAAFVDQIAQRAIEGRGRLC
nr:hypothetical protein [uncultured Cohaesibacter sp.]